MIRNATIPDYEDLRSLFDEVHTLSPYGDFPLDEAYMRRNWAMAVAMPNFFLMVSVDKADKARGVFAGHVAPNVWGTLVASDILVYSKYDTHRLIKAFRKWGLEVADFVSMTEVTNNPRYQKLIELCGFIKVGNIFSGGLS